MNMKELESLVIKQGEYIQRLERDRDLHTNLIGALTVGRQEDREAHMHMVQRVDNIVEGFKKELAMRDERIDNLVESMDIARRELTAIHEQNSGMQALIDGLCDSVGSVKAVCDELEPLVKGRNKSAAVKRNMTDTDATRVLTGDLKDMSHKDAAEVIGLTYAQVYSCRLEFTFKHVHKELRDAEWKNPWSK